MQLCAWNQKTQGHYYQTASLIKTTFSFRSFLDLSFMTGPFLARLSTGVYPISCSPRLWLDYVNSTIHWTVSRCLDHFNLFRQAVGVPFIANAYTALVCCQLPAAGVLQTVCHADYICADCNIRRRASGSK